MNNALIMQIIARMVDADVVLSFADINNDIAQDKESYISMKAVLRK